MIRSLKKLVYILLLGICFLNPADFRADIVYPARLELTETESGVFEVFFTLPVINGKVLKASPVLPETCENLSQPEISGSAYSKVLTWNIACKQEQIYGKQIGIEGLQGSQVEILLVINLLDGRSYNRKLSPAMAYFEVPYPPTSLELLTTGSLNGARALLLQPYFYLFLLSLIFFLGLSGNKKYYLALFLSIIAGYLLGSFELMKSPGWIFPVTSLFIAFLISLQASKSKLNSFSLLLILAPGLFLGNVLNLQEIEMVLTPGENLGYSVFFCLGIALGLFLAGILFYQLRNILIGYHIFEKILVPISILIGSLSLGLFIFEASLFWRTPSMLPQIPGVNLLFFLLLAIIGQARNLMTTGLSFAIFSTMGLILLMNGFSIPYAEIMLLALILISSIILLLKGTLPKQMLLLTIVLGSLLSGNILGAFANNNLSFPVGRSVGFLVFGLFLISILGSFRTNRPASGIFEKIISTALLGFGLILVIQLFSNEYFEGIASEYLSGSLPIPILSLVLIIAAVISWPRNRKIHRQMKLKSRKPVLSLSLVILAILLLPFHIGINNPWFEAKDLDQQGMKLIMENVLSNTYTAFNEEDEEKLFEELSRNVDTELLDNVYLDSRRRLNIGLREGAEVSVQEVELNSLGEPDLQTDKDVFEYPVQWTVTARVRHLKHIHYRKNSYTGTIALKSIDNKWKISKINLTSEDRKVIAASSL
ncbi:hypothetical protein C8P64_0843 [Christiangramia gaetbulicola]|uniref:Uncharacterized protein n=1 Tax=Christiangramia gaetbulicola TaxID=703340 RepID=A0A2T6AM42_9FLAO|nr:hypothetical protein [Christiangramia gaetbulicola]PTX44860.1 hypothetical protein C8P64_0843 [Christiangramia gaetbulicola]